MNDKTDLLALAKECGATIHFNDPGESCEFWPDQLAAFAEALKAAARQRWSAESLGKSIIAGIRRIQEIYDRRNQNAPSIESSICSDCIGVVITKVAAFEIAQSQPVQPFVNIEFTDRSTATVTEKAHRFLNGLRGGSAAYYFDDGFPRSKEIKQDSLATSALIYSLANAQLVDEKVQAVLKAAREWSCERSVKDWAEADLMKALATLDGDCPGCEECDHQCDEPCMPATVKEMHDSTDNQIAQLVHDGKLLPFEGYEPPKGFNPRL